MFGIFSENSMRSFVLVIFCYKFTQLPQAATRCIQCIFRTYADLILVGFSHHIYRKLLPKRKATNFKKSEKNCTENLQRHFSDISNLMTILNRKLIIIDNRKPKNCVKSQILPKVGIRNHVKWQNLPKIATENRFYTKFKFVKIEHCIQQRFKLIATSGIICNGTVV